MYAKILGFKYITTIKVLKCAHVGPKSANYYEKYLSVNLYKSYKVLGLSRLLCFITRNKCLWNSLESLIYKSFYMNIEM